MRVCVLLIVAAGLAGAADLTGSWACSVETDAGSGSPSFTLKQTGVELTGRYSGQLGEADLKGKVDGAKFTFSFPVGGDNSVVYTGALEGEFLKGTVDLAGQAKGTFNCRRK